MAEAPPVVAVFGATALGKSDVALALAARLDAEIVVADSMQVYAGLPIVTNQPDAAMRARASYHLVGVVPPQEEFTVGAYSAMAHDVIDRLLDAGRRVVVEGGSGLYLRAALGDLEFRAAPDAALRRSLEERWAEDPEALVTELTSLAPAVAERTDTRNGRRVIRALEEELRRDARSRRGSQDRLWLPPERYPHRQFALAPDDDRSGLTARIGARVEGMLAAGALEEVAAARGAGPLSRTVRQAIGVRELCAVLDGELALEAAAARMKARTRALARRQMTWMRKLPETMRTTAEGRSPMAVAADIAALLAEES